MKVALSVGHPFAALRFPDLARASSTATYVVATEPARNLLTMELTMANETLQAIPSNLNNVSQLYSAITGYQAPRF